MKHVVILKKISIMILLIGLTSYCEKHSPEDGVGVTSFSEEYTEQENKTILNLVTNIEKLAEQPDSKERNQEAFQLFTKDEINCQITQPSAKTLEVTGDFLSLVALKTIDVDSTHIAEFKKIARENPSVERNQKVLQQLTQYEPSCQLNHPRTPSRIILAVIGTLLTLIAAAITF